MFDAFFKVKENYLKISKEYKETFGKNIKFYEDYFASNSETVLVVLSSTGEASKDVIDKLRKEGKDVGLLRPILFRPFLYEEYSKALTKAKKIIVLERTESPGSFPPLYKEICLTVRDSKNRPEIFSFVFGLGGRDIYQKDIEELLVSVMSGKKIKSRYIGIKG
jgi:pyruvate ferredoxin oxidoreductase alpha subunit